MSVATIRYTNNNIIFQLVMIINKSEKENTSVFLNPIPGEIPLIGASASCSSYQQPRRGRGSGLQAGVAGTIGSVELTG
jgi:hypothetical protein